MSSLELCERRSYGLAVEPMPQFLSPDRGIDVSDKEK
jgi:hypothetical protein